MSLSSRGSMLMCIAVVLFVMAWAWFQSFYREVANLTGFKGPLPVECFTATSGPCRLPAMVASALGSHPYEPLLFWFALVIFVVGAVMKLFGDLTSRETAKSSCTKSVDLSGWQYGSPPRPVQPRDRIEPYL